MLTKVFKSANSQAVRLPKAFQTTDEEMIIKKIGNVMILVPVSDQWKVFEESLSEFSSDFFEEARSQPAEIQREEF